jgi:hypothetical protein
LNYYLAGPDLANFERPNALTHLYAYSGSPFGLGYEAEVRRVWPGCQYQQSSRLYPGITISMRVRLDGALAAIWYRLAIQSRQPAMNFCQLQNPGAGSLDLMGLGRLFSR